VARAPTTHRVGPADGRNPDVGRETSTILHVLHVSPLDAPRATKLQWHDLTPLEIKQSIIAAGLEVYRTTGEEVIVADRVRDNLILDSGVRVRAGKPMEVRLIMGLRRGQFPNESDDQLFARLRELASPAMGKGFVEARTGMAPVNDPADAKKTLDTFFELILVKPEADLNEMLELVRFAVKIAQTAESRH